MKTLIFNNINRSSIAKGLFIAAIYLAAAFLIFYIVFGGINGMSEKVNNFGGAKSTGFIIGGIVLIPFFIILRYIHPKISLEIDAKKISIKRKNKPEEIIYLSSIGRMEHNISKVNKLDIYDDKNVLLTFFNPNGPLTILNEIIDEILSHKEFIKDSKTENYFGNPLERTIYKSKR